jgi:hypothetical protein
MSGIEKFEQKLYTGVRIQLSSRWQAKLMLRDLGGLLHLTIILSAVSTRYERIDMSDIWSRRLQQWRFEMLTHDGGALLARWSVSSLLFLLITKRTLAISNLNQNSSLLRMEHTIWRILTRRFCELTHETSIKICEGTYQSAYRIPLGILRYYLMTVADWG